MKAWSSGSRWAIRSRQARVASTGDSRRARNAAASSVMVSSAGSPAGPSVMPGNLSPDSVVLVGRGSELGVAERDEHLGRGCRLLRQPPQRGLEAMRVEPAGPVRQIEIEDRERLRLLRAVALVALAAVLGEHVVRRPAGRVARIGR